MASSTTTTQVPSQLLAQQESSPNSRLEDLITSPPGLWLPSTVVRRHRTKATVIWIALLVAFCAYVVFIVYDGIKARKDPAASMEIKEEVFKFPDVGVCIGEGQGCYTDPETCFQVGAMAMPLQFGFLDDPDDVVANNASLAIEEAHPHCKVLPLSEMTVDRAGIDDGSITTLSATILALWSENPLDLADVNDTQIYSQVARIFFVDVDDGPEAFGNKAVDAVLPYETIIPIQDTIFTITQNHVLITLTEFTGISKDGKKKQTAQNYVQRSTSGKSHWRWTTDTIDLEAAFLWVTLTISKFEFTSIEEVDPVDAWTIIGAIGGVWQFVVVGFGLFFVFSEKQRPEFKMRNFKKTMNKPGSIIGRRLSGFSSKGDSIYDVVIDADGEDLPREWIKKQRPDGSVYYHNVVTNVRLDMCPHELGARGRHASTTAAPAFMPAHHEGLSVPQGSAYGTSGGRSRDGGGEVLPPGWIARTDGNGRIYYMNTIEKTSQWRRPTQRSSTTGTGTVQMVDAPMASARRGSGSTDPPPYSSVTSGTSGSETRVTNPLWPRAQPAGASGAAAAAAAGGRPATGGGRPSSTGRGNVGSGGSGGGGGGEPAAGTTLQSNPISGRGTETRAAGLGVGVATADAPLPPHWARLFTTEGTPFYANSVTKKTQWIAPRG